MTTIKRPGEVRGSGFSWVDIVGMRRAWPRGLSEQFCCQWQGNCEFRSEPHYDNRYATRNQLPQASLATFLSTQESNLEAASMAAYEKGVK